MKSNFFRGFKDSQLFDDRELFPIKNIKREEVLQKTLPYLCSIENALNDAFGKASDDRERNPEEHLMCPRRFADHVYHSFMVNLKKIPGVKVCKRDKFIWAEIDDIRIWFHKLEDSHLVHSQTMEGMMRAYHKTMNVNDTGALIILGYKSDPQNTKYVDLCFTQQEGEHISWYIDILDEIDKYSLALSMKEITYDNDLVNYKAGVEPNRCQQVN